MKEYKSIIDYAIESMLEVTVPEINKMLELLPKCDENEDDKDE